MRYAFVTAVPPGETVRESLKARGLSVKAAAVEIGVSRQCLHSCLRGRAGMTPEIAIGLERLGASDAEFWMRMQSRHDLEMERRRFKAAGGKRLATA